MPYVSKVTISKRLTDAPLVLFSQVSANMRQMQIMMQMQNPGGNDPEEMN